MISSSHADNKKLTVINLLSGPGCGKSVLAARIFAQMSIEQYKVDLVYEAAKQYKWENMDHIFPEQDYISSHQHRLIRCLVHHDVDYAVVDSSLLLAQIYQPYWFSPHFFPFILDLYNSYDNINIVLERNDTIAYQQTGRNETYEQALDKDKEIVRLLTVLNIPYKTVRVGDGDVEAAMSIIRDHVKPSTTFGS